MNINNHTYKDIFFNLCDGSSENYLTYFFSLSGVIICLHYNSQATSAQLALQ